MFCSRLSKNFHLVLTCLEMHINFKNFQFFSRKKESLFISTALLQLHQFLGPNLYLALKCKIMFFERYPIQVFLQRSCPKNQFEDRMGLKYSHKFKALRPVYTKTLFRLAILEKNVGDKFLKLRKICFYMKCFTMIFFNFLIKNIKIWLLVGRLSTHH